MLKLKRAGQFPLKYEDKKYLRQGKKTVVSVEEGEDLL